jgi:hypothetical protein
LRAFQLVSAEDDQVHTNATQRLEYMVTIFGLEDGAHQGPFEIEK